MASRQRNDRKPDAPVSYTNTDEVTLSAIDRWIEDRHPEDCEKLLESLLPGKFEYATTATRLLVHCIEHHDVGLLILAKYEASSFAYLGDDVGLPAALRTSQNCLLEELMERANELECAEHGAQATLTLLRAFDEDRFSKAWKFFWEPRPPRFPRLAGVAVVAAAWSPDHSRHLRRLLDEDVVHAYTAAPQDVVYSLMRAPALAQVRDEFLAQILRSGGLSAAMRIIQCGRGRDPTPVILDATRIVLEHNPESNAAPVGVAHCLGLNLNAVLPTIVVWMNSNSEPGTSITRSCAGACAITRTDFSRQLPRTR